MLSKTIPAMLAAGALVSPVHAEWTPALGIAARQFTLNEYDAGGRRIVQEQGWLPGLEGRLAYRTGDWTPSVQASHYRHDIAYRGQTQSGAPVDTRTDTALTQSGARIAYAINAMLSASLPSNWSAGGVTSGAWAGCWDCRSARCRVARCSGWTHGFRPRMAK
jgi:hypothetical protein